MSPKTFFKGREKGSVAGLLSVLCMLVIVPVCLAQDSTTNATEEQGQKKATGQDKGQPNPEEGKYRTVDILQPEPVPGQPQDSQANPSGVLEPIPIPINPMEEEQTEGGKTFLDDVFQSPRNRWGFALSAYQAYTTDLARNNQPRQSSGISAFMPSIFFNFGKRKSLFHVDLGAGYRKYSHRSTQGAWDYYGNSQYSLQFSKRTTFQIADQFNSSFNDAWSFLSLYSPLNYDPLSSNEVLFNRQRINRNALRAELSHQINRKASFSIFGGHRLYDYSRETLRNSSAIEFGGDFEYRLKKWLFVSSSATFYANLAEGSQPDANIYHVQIGGLDLRPTKSWRIWAGGGIDISDYQGQRRTGEFINGGVSYTAEKTLFTLTYQRGFTSAIGISRVLQSDVLSANLGRRLNDWISANLQSYYYRSEEAGSGGRLETLSGGGGFEFALCRSLSMSMNAFYQDQRTRNFSVQGLGLSRFTAYLGLQYVWPARRRGE